MEDYPTPIQTLHNLKGSEITVELKSGESVSGKLIAFDLYTNITVETENGVRFLQGTSVNFVYRGPVNKGIVAEAKVEEDDKSETAETEAEPAAKKDDE